MDSPRFARTQAAARHLLDAHHAKASFDALPAALLPLTVEEAYAVQDAFVALKAGECGRRCGWKIALTTPQMQRMVGLNTPIAGALHEGLLRRSPARIRAADYGRLIVEFEIAVELGADMPPRGAPYTPQEAGDAVAAMMPAFELADDRGADYATLASRGMELVADNAWNEGAVLGMPVPRWRDFDIASLRGIATINHAVVGEGTGADALGHPLNVVAWIANHLAGRGQFLKRGDLVITGSLVTSKFPAAGDHLGFDAGALGSIELDVA